MRRVQSSVIPGGEGGGRFPLGLALLVAGCAVNPATGERQLVLISESREIEMGREADQQISASLGAYDDPEIQAYVEQLGKRLAALSERPHLPWTFRVVDDPVVNAFALPGGFIYVTRGILAHFTSEAQLASVLGHEIGHVTARHSVEQLSRAQLTQIGLGVTSIVRPDLQSVTDLAGAGFGLLFLKYGRDDESQADDLGLRYMFRGGYDPRPMAQVFDMLGRVSQAAGGRGTPEWLSTHPDPENRKGRMEEAIGRLQGDFDSRAVARDSYLERIDGIPYGNDPRQGFFRETLFMHPDLEFQIRFPAGWQTANRPDAVLAGSPEQDAIMQLDLAPERTSRDAAAAFFGQQGMSSSGTRNTSVGSMPAVVGGFQVTSDQGELRGTAAFVDYGGKVFRILGYGVSSKWSGRSEAVNRSMESFAELTDREALDVEPLRIEIVTIERSMTLRDFHSRYSSAVPVETLALLNQVTEDTRFMARAKVKNVVGELPG